MSYYSSYAFGIPDWDAHEILPDIYLGSATAAQAERELKERNITHIISINHSPDYIPFHPEKFEYLVVIADDDLYQEILSVINDCFAFIDECLKENGKVLIHCTAGVSRSATIVTGYVMREYKCTYDIAVTMVQGMRPYVQPNLGFSGQLKIFHKMGMDLSKLKPSDTKDYHLQIRGLSRYSKGKKYLPHIIEKIKNITSYQSLQNLVLFYSVLPNNLK